MIRGGQRMMHNIRTVQSLARSARRLDRLNGGVEHVVALMRAGASLHCTHRPKSTDWAAGFAVSEHVAHLVIKRADIVGVGDCLFGPDSNLAFH
jgi:hypothetical protein